MPDEIPEHEQERDSRKRGEKKDLIDFGPLGIMPKLRPLEWSLLGSVTHPCPLPVIGGTTRPGSLAHMIHDRSYWDSC